MYFATTQPFKNVFINYFCLFIFFEGVQAVFPLESSDITYTHLCLSDGTDRQIAIGVTEANSRAPFKCQTSEPPQGSCLHKK